MKFNPGDIVFVRDIPIYVSKGSETILERPDLDKCNLVGLLNKLAVIERYAPDWHLYVVNWSDPKDSAYVREEDMDLYFAC